MDGIPIIYSKDVNTGAISQVKSVGNVLLSTSGTLDNLTDVVITAPSANQILKYSSPNWINDSLALSNLSNVVLTSPATGQSLTYDGTNWTNQTKDYIVINMYGTTVAGVYSTTTEKYPMVCSSTYWGMIPNPNNGTQGQVSSLRSNVYTTGTGVITLDTNRKYIIRASINMGGQNLNAVTNAELRLKQWTGTGTNFVNFTPDYSNQTVLALDFTGASLETVGYVSNSPGFTVTFRFMTAQAVALSGFDTSITVTAMEI
jgi:hypothetical protein